MKNATPAAVPTPLPSNRERTKFAREQAAKHRNAIAAAKRDGKTVVTPFKAKAIRHVAMRKMENEKSFEATMAADGDRPITMRIARTDSKRAKRW